MINEIHFGDCRDSLKKMAAAGVKAQTCVTSPPYFGLRDYGHEGQIGLEPTPEHFIAELVEVFRCVRDVLADDGTLWVNIGDSYARNPAKGGSGPGGKNGAYSDTYTEAGKVRTYKPGVEGGVKEKDLIGIPWMLAFALRADGWYLRQDIIWHKPNPMPESVRDRCTKAHEYVFLLSKSARYYYDVDAIREPIISTDKRAARPGSSVGNGAMRSNTLETLGLTRGKTNQPCSHPAGKNKRSVWTVTPRPYAGAHFAVFPPELIEPCVLAGSRLNDVVLDPFMGSGTTAAVAIEHGRQFIGCELNPAYKPLQDARIDAAYSKGLL